MKKDFKFLQMEPQDRHFLNEMFHINIECEDDEVVWWEEIDGNITNDQTIYIIELLMRHNYLPTQEPIKYIMVVSNSDGERNVIDVFPTDNNCNMVYDEDGKTIAPVILQSHFLTLQ